MGSDKDSNTDTDAVTADRAFRSTVDALLEVEKLRRREIEFQIVNLNVDTATPVGELIYTVMAAVSQFERQTLIRRTKEGMVAAKQRGKRIGRPRKPFLEEVALAHSRIEAGEGMRNAWCVAPCSRESQSRQV